ncbi:MAG: succinate dehydrogenase, hydrophobic membrane anchor protein [Thiotrichaceae bacterium]
MNDLRSPLAKAKGLGASGDATRHFWVQRLTALALIPLTLWFGFSVAMLPEANYETVVAWLQSPFNTVMLVLVVIVAFQHAHLGMQVIFEDYISDHSKRMFAVLTTKFISYFMMVLGVYSILKIALGNS